MLHPEGVYKRALLLRAVRSFFDAREYWEADTPIRLPVHIPEANINPVESESAVLQTSPEMCMKMLMANGCSRLYQICHCFRKEENGRYHLPEFSMVEWYHQDWNYHNLMDECEELVRFLAASLSEFSGVCKNGQALCVGEREISLTAPWPRMTVSEAFRRYARVDVFEVLQEDMFDQVLVEQVEPHLGTEQPVFLYDYPAPLASLSKTKQNDPTLAERFELYISGIELANGFSELCDPVVLRNRFEMEVAEMAQGGKKALLPEAFLHSLSFYPESAGIAFGLDRMLLLLEAGQELKQVVSLHWDDMLLS